MRLRSRLVLSVVVVMIPLSLGLRAVLVRSAQDSLESGAREFALGAMQTGGRSLCERFPKSFPDPPKNAVSMFGGMLPPQMREMMAQMNGAPPEGRLQPKFWAYDRDFESRNADAPQLSEEIQRAFRRGDGTGSVFEVVDGVETVRVLTAMPWEGGPCELIMVQRAVPEHHEDIRTLSFGLAILALALVLALLLAVGPVVARIRRLREAVQDAADDNYADSVPVEGADEIADLAESFNLASARVRRQISQIEARELALRSFVADTTHDVMTPLTVLKGHLSKLTRGEDLGETDRSRLMHCIEEVQYMASLVNNLGVAARLEGVVPELASDRLDLVPIVERVVERHRPESRARGIELSHAVPEENVIILGDLTLIEQALGNVVHNAIRHHDREGHVSVTLEVSKTRFELRVLDDGPGVDESVLTKITERHFRVDAARSRDDSGHGLGLSIAQEVCRRHGIQLEFVRPEEGGLEVTLAGDLEFMAG